MKRKRVVDLFAGIGGLSSGFEGRSEAFDIEAYEADENIAKQLSKRVKTHCVFLTLDNVRDIGKCDYLLGGPPCQPFSKAGAQRGSSDVRNHLPTFVAAVRFCKPVAFVMENVENLATKHKDILDDFLKETEGLGYRVAWSVLDASFYEVPQKRRRLFVVGTRRGTFRFPKPHEKRCVVGDVLDAKESLKEIKGLEITSSWSERIAKYEEKSKTRPRILYFDEPSRTLTTKNLGCKTNDVLRIRVHEHVERCLTVQEACKLQTIPCEWLKHCERKLAFKIIGNSVPPNLSRHLVDSLLDMTHR